MDSSGYARRMDLLTNASKGICAQILEAEHLLIHKVASPDSCRQGMSALYVRAPRLFEEFNLCHADGSFPKRLAAIAKINVLIIDDFAIAPIGPREGSDLLELLDDRTGNRACIVTSQLPVNDWHDYIGDPTLADAILDRLVHRAHKIHLEAKESLRGREAAKQAAKETTSAQA
jgi:DNA replication protein DnaC